MEWVIIAVTTSFGFWNWRQRNAFRLRAYLLEQKYVHGAPVERAIAAQLRRDRIELAMPGRNPVTADLLGRREAVLQLEREADRLGKGASTGRGMAARTALFPARGERRPEPTSGVRVGAAG